MVDHPLILFYGDSRAADWPEPAMPAVRFANRGIPGDDTAGALHRFPRDVAALDPAVVVLQLGVNDLTEILFAPHQQAGIVAACRQNLRQLIAQVTGLGAALILTTIFPPAVDPWTGWRPDLEALAGAIQQVNHDLRRLAGQQVVLLETGPLLADEQGRVQPHYAVDALHLNRAGYAALNQALTPLLSALRASL